MKGVKEENTIRKFAVLVLSHATCPKLAKQGLGIWTHHHGDILGGDELCIFFFDLINGECNLPTVGHTR